MMNALLTPPNQSLLSEVNDRFRKRDYEHVIRLCQGALDIGENPDILVHTMVLALKSLGRYDDAIRALYLGLARQPKSSLLKGLLEYENAKHIRNWDGPMLSVIVPVYNSGRYLEQCLNSILTQSFRDLELIVVNDGSTDKSAEIIFRVSQMDGRVTVITNSVPSGSPGRPRNQALKIAKGAYIGFVDSDDWIEPGFYQELMDKAMSDAADIVFSGGFLNHRGQEVDQRTYSSTGFDDPEATTFKCHDSFMIWDKVFNAKLIRAFDLRLGEGKAAVDVPFIIQSYYLASKVSFCSDLIGYNYRRDSESSVTVNYRRSSDCQFELAAYDAVEAWSKDFNVAPRYLKTIAFKKVSSFVYTLSVIAPRMFDRFYAQARVAFTNIDRSVVEKFSESTGKRHVLEKYDAVLNVTPAQYRAAFRKGPKGNGIDQTEATGKSVKGQHTFYIKGNNKGIMFFPDWTNTNPYQKLLYAGIAREYDVRIKGYRRHFFRPDMLDANRQEFECIHFHWLHVFMDFSCDDGADKFIRYLEHAKSLGYKLLYTAHNIISHDSPFKDRERKFRQRVSEYFDHILVHGEFAKRRIVDEIGVDPNKVTIVPHGSYEGYYPDSTSKEVARDRFGIDPSAYVFLFFGNIKGYKGVDKLLDAYSEVKRQRPNVRLILAGRVFEESVRIRIESVARKDSSVIFHSGFIEERDVQYYFKAADIVVLPYRRILTSGAAILSVSYHKPVIAPRSGLIPELVANDDLGHLFDSYDEMTRLMLEVSLDNSSGRDFSVFREVNEQLRWSKLAGGAPFNHLFSHGSNYGQAELARSDKPYKYALLRILGNDLPFRHNENQTLTNLEFMLEHEKEFDDCVKIWVLNRIIDESKKQAIINLLERYRKRYVDIPYSASELKEVPFCYEDLPVDHFKLTPEFSKLSDRSKTIVDAVIFKHKNNYIMNNNGARNAALAEGVKMADWVFPWDGNCFITEQAWESITSTLKARSDVPYHIVPMDRLMDNEAVVARDYLPNPVEEPQIVFRADAELSFDEKFMYGFKPKVDLLKRLGVPGIWSNWNTLYPWKRHSVQYDKNTYNFVWNGWVARLFSGDQGLELNLVDRGINRERGIVEFIRTNDMMAKFSNFDRGRLAYYNDALLRELKENPRFGELAGLGGTLNTIRQHAEEYLANPVYSVIGKTTLPPSGDRKDYWHPAPYSWPNPETADGLPYIYKDGERVPGTRMYEPESIKYDRTSLQRMFDETTALALAGYLFENKSYTEKAYRLIHTWFVNPITSMNPHLTYSQVVMGKNRNRGTASGLIETKDFYFFLDAVRLVKRTSLWTEHDESAMNTWCRKFMEWLSTSEQGSREVRTKNNHGNAYDLQVYSLAAYLGDTDVMYDVMIRASSRLQSHILPDGRQPHELKRTTTAHYTAFNLHLWLSLNSLLENTAGLSLVESEQFYGKHGRHSALKLAATWVLRYGLLPIWPFKQIDEFDKARYEHIYHSMARHLPEFENRYGHRFKTFDDAKEVYFPHDGIAPYWKLSIAAS